MRRYRATDPHYPVTRNPPLPPRPLEELTIRTLVVENVHDPQLMSPGDICYLASHFDDNFLRND